MHCRTKEKIMKQAIIKKVLIFLGIWVAVFLISFLGGEEMPFLMRIGATLVMAILATLVWLFPSTGNRNVSNGVSMPIISCRKCGYYGAGSGACPKCGWTVTDKITPSTPIISCTKCGYVGAGTAPYCPKCGWNRAKRIK